MPTKIRLHKAIKNWVAENKIEYTSPEINANIEKFGVEIPGLGLVNSRMQWLDEFDKPNPNWIKNWPKREKSDYSKSLLLNSNTYKADEFMVIFKSAGVVTEAGIGHRQDNLTEHLKQKYSLNFLKPVHRLDKDTVGILLLATSPNKLEYLQAKFKQRLVIKKYLTLLHGKLPKSITLEGYQKGQHLPSPRQILTQNINSLEDKDSYRYVKSKFKPLQYFYIPNILNTDQVKNEINKDSEAGLSHCWYTLAEVQIYTGRTHQIRVAAEFIGYPLVNDPIYNQENETKESKMVKSKLKKQANFYTEITKITNISQITSKLFKKSTSFYLKAKYLELETEGKSRLGIEC